MPTKSKKVFTQFSDKIKAWCKWMWNRRNDDKNFIYLIFKIMFHGKYLYLNFIFT